MSIRSLAYQQSVFKRYCSSQHFSEFYLQDGGAKTSWSRYERNYATVIITLSICQVHITIVWPCACDVAIIADCYCRLLAATFGPLTNGWFLHPPSPRSKRHLDRFIRFCRAHGGDRHWDTRRHAHRPRYMCGIRPHCRLWNVDCGAV